MNNELTKKYGLLTAICMVVGIVIGSGVFFKAEKVLTATGGDMKTAILAWLLGGMIMIICAYTVAIMGDLEAMAWYFKRFHEPEVRARQRSG